MKGKAIAIDRDTLSNITRKMEILCRNLNRSVQPGESVECGYKLSGGGKGRGESVDIRYQEGGESVDIRYQGRGGGGGRGGGWAGCRGTLSGIVTSYLQILCLTKLLNIIVITCKARYH